MSKFACMTLAMLLALTAASAAGDDPGAVPENGAPETEAPAFPAEEAAPEDARPTGDTIRFKSGRELTGVRVLRHGPAVLLVEVMPGVDPMELPLSQIESIELDERTHRDTRRRRGGVETESAPDYIQGKELSPALSQKLRSEVSETPIREEGVDYVPFVTSIAGNVTAPLAFSDEVLALPPDARRWNPQIPANTTFLVMLYEHLLPSFPDLAVTYEFNRIVVRLETRAPRPAPEADSPFFE